MTVTFNDKITARLATLVTGNGYDMGKVNALSKSIKGRGASLDVDMHTAAVAALALSDAHRDANSMSLLLNAMPMGSRRETLAVWAATFGNIIVTKNKAKAFVCKMQKVEDCLPVDLVKAKATPFWSPAEKVDVGAFSDADACKQLAAFVKRARSDKADLSPTMLELVTKLNVMLVKATPAEVVPA